MIVSNMKIWIFCLLDCFVLSLIKPGQTKQYLSIGNYFHANSLSKIHNIKQQEEQEVNALMTPESLRLCRVETVTSTSLIHTDICRMCVLGFVWVCVCVCAWGGLYAEGSVSVRKTSAEINVNILTWNSQIFLRSQTPVCRSAPVCVAAMAALWRSAWGSALARMQRVRFSDFSEPQVWKSCRCQSVCLSSAHTLIRSAPLPSFTYQGCRNMGMDATHTLPWKRRERDLIELWLLEDSFAFIFSCRQTWLSSAELWAFLHF